MPGLDRGDRGDPRTHNTQQCEVRARNCKNGRQKQIHEDDMQITRGGCIVRTCSNPLCQIEALETIREALERKEDADGETRMHHARSVS